MNTKAATLLVLVLSLLVTQPAAANNVAANINGPNGHLLSPAEINEAYQHVANTRLFLQVMQRYGVDKLIYHCREYCPNAWIVRYYDQDEMREGSREDTRRRVNWRFMVMDYMTPFIDHKVKIGHNGWGGTRYSQTGNSGAIVFRTFDKHDVDEAREALYKITDVLERDWWDPDDSEAQKAATTLSGYLTSAIAKLSTLLRRSPPGNVNLRLRKPFIRPEYARMIGMNNSSNDQNIADQDDGKGGGDDDSGKPNVTTNQDLIAFLGVNAPGAVDGMGGNNNTQVDVNKMFGHMQTATDTYKPGQTGGGLGDQQLASLMGQWIQSTNNMNNLPTGGDANKMNNDLNGLGGNLVFPDKTCFPVASNTGKGGCFDPLNSNGYQFLNGQGGATIIIVRRQGDRNRVQAYQHGRNNIARELMAAGVPRDQAIQKANQIMQQLSPYMGLNVGHGVNPGQYNNNPGQTSTGQWVVVDPSQYSNTGPFTYDDGNNNNNTGVNHTAKEYAALELQKMSSYINVVYSDRFMTTDNARVAGFLEQPGRTQDGQSMKMADVYLHDATNFKRNLAQSQLVRVLGANNPKVRALNSRVNSLQQALVSFRSASSQSAKEAAVRRIKQAANNLRQANVALNQELRAA